MTVHVDPDFECQHCEHKFFAAKRYSIKYNNPNKQDVAVSICPKCNKRTEMPLNLVVQRSIINPLCPKTTYETVIRDRPLWV